MPPAAAIAVPAALGVASLISGNAQNKAANANNLNQQAGAVQNAQAAESNAAQQAAALIKANPGPFAGQSIQGPGSVKAATPTAASTTTSPSPLAAPQSNMTGRINAPGGMRATPMTNGNSATIGTGGGLAGNGLMNGTPQTSPGAFGSLVSRINMNPAA